MIKFSAFWGDFGTAFVFTLTAISAIAPITAPANCSVSSTADHNETKSLMCNTTQDVYQGNVMRMGGTCIWGL